MNIICTVLGVWCVVTPPKEMPTPLFPGGLIDRWYSTPTCDVVGAYITGCVVNTLKVPAAGSVPKDAVLFIVGDGAPSGFQLVDCADRLQRREYVVGMGSIDKEAIHCIQLKP